MSTSQNEPEAKVLKPPVILSFDVECTGNSPVMNSCVMLGFAVVKKGVDPDDAHPEQWLLERKQWCIKEYRPRCAKCWNDFWLRNQRVWKHIQTNARDVRTVMAEFAEWYRSLAAKYTIEMVAKPAAYDWQWLNCLHEQFGPLDRPSIGFKATCLSTLITFCEQVTGMTSQQLGQVLYSNKFKHTHMADDDAVGQAYAYLKLCARFTSLYTAALTA